MEALLRERFHLDIHREQLGLKLEARRGEVSVIVVHADLQDAN